MKSEEALDKLDNTLCLNINIKYGIDSYDFCDCISQEDAIDCIDTIRKDLEVLSLLKQKKIDISWFLHSIEVTPNDTQALNMYNLGCDNGYSITKDEFKILKEWLNG